MPAADAHRFLDQVNRDPILQRELVQAEARFVEIGREHGFDFTQEELHDDLRQRWGIEKAVDEPNTCTVTVP